MPIFNILEHFIQLDFVRYIFMAFVFYGLNLGVKKMIKGGNPI